VHEASLIILEQISNVMNNFYECLIYCQTVEGRYFEHLINWKNGNILKGMSLTHARARARAHTHTHTHTTFTCTLSNANAVM